MSNYNLIVLSYHRFTDESHPYAFSRTYDQFEYDVNKKCYDWITIDDGHASIIKACDIMRAANVRAKLFIPTSLVGTPGYCNWEDLIKLSRYHDIENHSHLHIRLPELPRSIIWESMSMAHGMITENIKRAPRYFVPPYNQFDERIDEMANDLELSPLKDRITIKNDSK